jgi:conjugal transfer pilin signal peptidase TrbI
MGPDVPVARERLGVRRSLILLLPHYRRFWPVYAAGMAVLVTFQSFFRLDFNLTESLPDHVYLTVKGERSPLRIGDHVTFVWHGGGGYPAGMNFVKLVAGLPGDRITMDADRMFFREGDVTHRTALGRAKARSRTGEGLRAGRTGAIPPGYFYAMAPHPDSLDSRYALVGWIPQAAIVGKCYPLF